MAVAVTPVTPLLTGVLNGSVNADPGGNSFPNPRGTLILRINNGGGAPINATVAAQQTSRPADGTFPPMTLANDVVAVAAGAAKYIGPIPPAFNDGNGNVQLTYSSTTSVTVEAIQP